MERFVPSDMLETVPLPGDPSRKKRAQDDVPGELQYQRITSFLSIPLNGV
jgi:hypothetical protein